MPKLTPIQKRKKTQKLLEVIVGLIVLTAIVLFFGLGREIVPGGRGPILTPQATQDAARILIKEVHITKSFFEDGILEDFIKYTPLQAPLIYGKINPFQ